MRPAGRRVLIEGRIGGEHRLGVQVHHAEARWPDNAQPRAGGDLAQLRHPRQALRPGLAEAVGEHGHDLHAEPAAVLHGFDRAVRPGHDVDVLRHLRQCLKRWPGALAQHRVAASIDRIDAPPEAGLPQIFERAGRRSCRHRSIGRRSRPSAAPTAPAPSRPPCSHPAMSFGGVDMALALVEAAIEDVLGDAVLQHLDRAARDHPAAGAPHAILHQRLATVAERAHDLDAIVRHLEAGLVAGGLGESGSRRPRAGRCPH